MIGKAIKIHAFSYKDKQKGNEYFDIQIFE